MGFDVASDGINGIILISCIQYVVDLIENHAAPPEVSIFSIDEIH